MSESVSSYRDLRVWRRGIELSLVVYKLTAAFPSDERFGLISQLRRAAVSVPSNIAEGHARDSTKDFLRHLSIARGSLAEVETQAEIAGQLGFLDQNERQGLHTLCAEEGRMINRLQQSLKRHLGSANKSDTP